MHLKIIENLINDMIIIDAPDDKISLFTVFVC